MADLKENPELTPPADGFRGGPRVARGGGGELGFGGKRMGGGF